jgi:hypothetical protein
MTTSFRNRKFHSFRKAVILNTSTQVQQQPASDRKFILSAKPGTFSTTLPQDTGTLEG